MAELLPAARADIEARLAPVDPAVMAGLMQRMWDAGVPQPEPITLAEWRRLLSPYPAAVLASAFDQVVRTHRWPDPPKIADVVRWVGEAMTRLTDWRHTIAQAELRAKLEAKGRADDDARRARVARWQAGLSPEDRDALAQVRARLAAGESAAAIVAGSMRT
ncbi:hypothetical protein [Phaeospirillum tilakii]|uniref:Replication region DNA-binding N-term n=1 Tax=Phaeospirillum tilakii TaxID=741673 RepID=A0ABW5C9Q3_9PROT